MKDLVSKLNDDDVELMEGGKRRRTKKGSKKGSKKMSGGKKRGSKKGSKKGSKRGSKGGANPIMMKNEVAMGLFHKFGKKVGKKIDKKTGKEKDKWALPNVADGLGFRGVLGEILKDNNNDVNKSIKEAGEKYESGELKKMAEKLQKQYDANRKK